jgi:hypothetical protein
MLLDSHIAPPVSVFVVPQPLLQLIGFVTLHVSAFQLIHHISLAVDLAMCV